MRVFSIEPQSTSPLTETYGYMTEVQRSWDGHEKRIQKRRRPLGSLEYSFLLADEIEAQALSCLLYDSQEELWLMPLWQYATKLTADTNDSTLVFCATVNVPFLDVSGLGYQCIIWRSQKLFEAHRIASIASDQVQLGEPVNGSWPATSSYILPCRVARLEPSVKLSRLSSSVLQGTVRAWFALDMTPAAPSTAGGFVEEGEVIPSGG